MKKNILIVLSALNMGGAQRNASILANEWAKAGYKVTLICTHEEEIVNHFLIHKDVNLIIFRKNFFTSKFRFLNLLRKLFKLRKIIKSQDPDVIISFLARINLAAALANLGTKKSLIICERTWPPFASLNNNFAWFYNFLFKGVHKVIVQTEKSRIWLNENFSFKNIAVIPNPVKYPLPSEKHKNVNPNDFILNGKKIILASGRMHKHKQFDLLIKAFHGIKDRHKLWNLVILGDGEERENLVEILKEKKIEDRVFFPGKVTNISDWYSASELFVLSSMVEGFPNVLLEAMSYGVPSISFDCDTGPREIIEDKVNGILVSPNEKEIGLYKALDELIKDEKLRKKISKKAIMVRDKYSIENIMLKWNESLKT
tara:strand:+ start:4392 stop:5504 length:1113 start_codon:yes stop_codon:yes gene_type:complete